MRDQIQSDHLLGNVVNVFHRAREFDAAALAAPARVDLRFDDYRQSQFLRGFFSLGDRSRNPAARNFDIKTAQQFLTLILVNLHKIVSMIKSESEKRSGSVKARALKGKLIEHCSQAKALGRKFSGL
jgi:hypothetical protein